MKNAKLLLITLLLSSGVLAQGEALFNRATTAYNNGEYLQAVDNYLKILEEGEHSAALYFNLANSYYKLNQIAPSIYYYEKALLLKPGDREIENNLAYAQNMTLDAIEALPETGLSKIYRTLIGWLSFDQWAKAAVMFILIFVLGYISFYYLKYSSHKRIAFMASIVSLLFAASSLFFAFMQYNGFTADQPAIVFAEEVTVKSEPNDRSPEAFVLHEGTKVNVLDTLDEWNKVQLIDGQIGWLPTQDIRLLKDF